MKNQHRKLALRHLLITVAASVALFGCVGGSTTASSEPAVEGASLSTDPTTVSSGPAVEGASLSTDPNGPDTNFKDCCTTFICESNGYDLEWCTGNGPPGWAQVRNECRAHCGGVQCAYGTFCEEDRPRGVSEPQ